MIILSYAGSLIISLAYLLLAINVIKNQSNIFFILLLIGNIFFSIFSYETESYPVLLLNLGFMFFAVTAILNKRIQANWVNFKLFLIIVSLTIISSLYLNYSGHYIIETLGWFSMVGGFGSYFLYTQNKISVLNYFLINMVVNLTFSSYLFFHENYPYMALQLLVFLISSIGVINILKTQKSELSLELV
jgi:hypothetical protein